MLKLIMSINSEVLMIVDPLLYSEAFYGVGTPLCVIVYSLDHIFISINSSYSGNYVPTSMLLL